MSNFYTSIDVHKNKLLFRGVENGKRVKHEIPYRPYLFVADNNSSEESYKTIHGKKVNKVDFPSMSDARQFIKQYEDVKGFDVYGSTTFGYVYLYDKYKKNIEIDKSQIRRCYIDIETWADSFPNIETANKPITLITVATNKLFITFGWYKDYSAEGRPNVAGIRHKYLKFKDETSMLAAFLKWWQQESYTPDIISGWNCRMFDWPYIIHRIQRVLGNDQAKKLSPWNVINQRKVVIAGREQIFYEPLGIAILDYLELYKKFTYNQQESYKLEHIAQVELGKGKLDYSQYGSLHQFFLQDYESFVEYNILDVMRVIELEDKMSLIDLAITMAYDAGVNYNEVLGTVKVWDTIIHNYLMNQNIVVEPYKRDNSVFSIAGGFVKEPQIGMHNWVASWDCQSLYPHIIIQNNISPDTFVGKLSEAHMPTIDQIINDDKLSVMLPSLIKNDLTIAANGATYKRHTQSFLGVLMRQQFGLRKDAQDKIKQLKTLTQTEDVVKEIKHLDILQMAKKIQINSCFGALANQYFRWFSPTNAEAITLSGQLVIKWIAKHINDLLNSKFNTENEDYVVASDTDSVYLRLERVGNTREEIDIFCREILEPLIDEKYRLLADSTNACINAMHMKREIIADKMIIVAKKRYVASMVDKEGTVYDPPKLKIMGIEAVRSSTPSSCRNAIKDTLNVIMTSDETHTQGYISEFRKKFQSLPFESVASPRGVNGITKYKNADKSIPIHVRGSFVYNALLKKHGLENDLPPIVDKDKIRFCYLKEPNIAHSNVIACPDGLPRPSTP